MILHTHFFSPFLVSPPSIMLNEVKHPTPKRHYLNFTSALSQPHSSYTPTNVIARSARCQERVRRGYPGKFIILISASPIAPTFGSPTAQPNNAAPRYTSNYPNPDNLPRNQCRNTSSNTLHTRKQRRPDNSPSCICSDRSYIPCNT